MGFEGFTPDFAAFFRDLAANQNRDWFQANKARYETFVREPMRELLLDLNRALASRHVPLGGDPKRSLTRINRDVRFSADKSPYKTSIAATFTREPGEMSPGLLYVHVSAEDNFAGIGFYAIDPADLAALRSAIVDRSDDWLMVTSALEQAGHPLEPADALKRMPKGFEQAAGSAVADHLRLKAHVCKLRLGADDLNPELPDRIASFAASCAPLLEFGWRALAGRNARAA